MKAGAKDSLLALVTISIPLGTLLLSDKSQEEVP